MAYIFWYKITCLLVGLTLCWLGYNLFIKGVFRQAGNFTGTWKTFKIVVTRAAPGLYFVLFGTIVIGATVYKGFNLEECPIIQKVDKSPLVISPNDTLPKVKDSTPAKK